MLRRSLTMLLASSLRIHHRMGEESRGWYFKLVERVSLRPLFLSLLPIEGLERVVSVLLGAVQPHKLSASWIHNLAQSFSTSWDFLQCPRPRHGVRAEGLQS